MPGEMAGDGQPQSTPALPRSRWWRLPLSPVADLPCPRRAATQLLTASRAGFVGMLLLGSMVLGVTSLGLDLWDETLAFEWVPPATAPATLATTVSVTMPATGPTTMMAWGGWQQERRERTMAEVWRERHADALGGWFGWTEVGLLANLPLTAGLIAIASWVNLPLVHRAGPVGRSYRRTFRATTSALWPLTVLVIAIWTLYVLAERNFGADVTPPQRVDPEFHVVWSLAVSGTLLGLWLRRAIGAADSGVAPLDIPPRCEECGYDLTHRPAEGRCPECGGEIDASLDAPRSRPGSSWEQRPSLLPWLTTCVECVFRPRRFYRRLELRTAHHYEVGFAAVNYGAIGLGAWLWCATVVLRDAGGLSTVAELLGVASIATLYGTFGLAAGHRLFAALMASVWLGRGELADFAWARKVIAYETAFLWVFCAFWGGNSTLLMMNVEWLSSLLGLPDRYWWPLGMPLEALVLFLGTLGLVALWAVRYGWAYRAIRWSNY